ncbi:TPA: AraC family transcriptional regulator ligand-binding domain-containing protein [Enterobacter soli]|nr:AraC family transcriptional regulator ligand-binding domain-containing protein [Enterobacter soli]
MVRNQTFFLNIGWRALLKDLGVRQEHVLRRAELPEDLLSRTNEGLPTEAYFRFWQGLEDEVEDVLFPLKLVGLVSTESFDPPLFAALCSASLAQAVQRLAKYKQLMMPMSLEIAVNPRGEMTISPRWLLAQDQVPRSLQVAELAFYIRLMQLATREPVNALRVTLPELPPPSYARQFSAFFGVPVTQGQYPSITFSSTDVLRPFLTVNEGMWRVFEPELRRRLSELDATATTRERVSAVLLELIPGGTASIDKVALRLGMSRRTLQRRLELEGESFRTLINHTREKLARHYLENSSFSSGEIAFLLGFEEPNSFYRAFHEWTGQTPDAARRATFL